MKICYRGLIYICIKSIFIFNYKTYSNRTFTHKKWKSSDESPAESYVKADGVIKVLKNIAQ